MSYISHQDITGILYKIADIIRVYDEIMSLHDCNDCGRKHCCPYVPKAGQMVRINCPLWDIGEINDRDTQAVLISRQDVIDALRKGYWDKDIQSAKDDPCIVDAVIDWAIRQVKGVPSAKGETE